MAQFLKYGNGFVNFNNLSKISYDDNEATFCITVGGMIGTTCDTTKKKDDPNAYQRLVNGMQELEKRVEFEEKKRAYKMQKYKTALNKVNKSL